MREKSEISNFEIWCEEQVMESLSFIVEDLTWMERNSWEKVEKIGPNNDRIYLVNKSHAKSWRASQSQLKNRLRLWFGIGHLIYN